VKLLTNNPAFLNYDKKNIEVDYRETDYLGILKIARDYVHENYRILTHPLYGSVKPNETIYRSVVLVKGDLTDTDSVVLLASAIETFEKFTIVPKFNKEEPPKKPEKPAKTNIASSASLSILGVSGIALITGLFSKIKRKK